MMTFILCLGRSKAYVCETDPADGDKFKIAISNRGAALTLRTISSAFGVSTFLLCFYRIYDN